MELHIASLRNCIQSINFSKVDVPGPSSEEALRGSFRKAVSDH